MPQIITEEMLTLQNIAMTALVALLSWNVYTTQELKTNVAVIKTEISNATRDRFTASDGRLLEQRLARLEEWNGRLSGRLASLEEDWRQYKISKPQ